MSKEEAQADLKPVSKHTQFTTAFYDAYLEKFGRRYVHQGAKDGSPLKKFLLEAPHVTIKDWVDAANAAWKSNDRWIRSNVVTIAMLCSQWNKIQATLPPPTEKPKGW